MCEQGMNITPHKLKDFGTVCDRSQDANGNLQNLLRRWLMARLVCIIQGSCATRSNNDERRESITLPLFRQVRHCYLRRDFL